MLAQAVKDVITSYEALVNLFERIQFFLQRLNRYTAVRLTPEMVLLLGKIMAQVLSVLALSTKEMKERRISASICLIFSFMADYETEKFMKRIIGRTDVDDALARLDMLTKEENLMTVARNLEVTHRVDVNVTATQELTRLVDDRVTTVKTVVHDVDCDVKATQKLTHHVDDNVTAIKEVIRDVEDNVKATRELTHLVDDNITRIKEVVHDVDGNVKETKELTQSIHDDVKVTKHGAQPSISSHT
jgi:methyl-accepting chemotaxis protein